MPDPTRLAGRTRSPRDACLRLDDRFTHIAFADENVVLVGDDDSVLVESPIAGDVIRLLDGRHTAVEIAESLEVKHAPEVVHFVLLTLQHRGIVQQGEQDRPVSGQDSESLEIVTDTASRLRTLWEQRGEAGLVMLPFRRTAGFDIDLVLTDDYLHPDLTLVEFRHKTVLACLGYRRVWVGPVIIPGAGPCVECLQDRLRLNLAARAMVHVRDGAVPEGLTVERIERAIPAAAYHQVALGVQRICEGEGEALSGGCLEAVPLGEDPSELHRVMRLPHCAGCGDPTLGVRGADIELRSRPKAGRSGGGYRTLEPAETLRCLSILVSPLTGVVRHIRKVDVDGTDLVHVYTASHALHYGAGNLRVVKSARRDPSGGKGMTDLDARVSALCESLERFSGVHRGNETVVMARLSQLGSEVVPPNELLLYSTRQFDTRNEWNATDTSGFQWVPEPYRDEPIEWSQVRCLGTGDTRLVPAASVYLGFRGAGARFAKGDSNGLAGGNCLEEAILQGFLELVERDAVALWWYNRVPRLGVDFASFEHPWVDRLVDYYATLNRSLWALDLTTDLGIPCFAAFSAIEDRSQQDIIFGFGAHLDARIGLVRALTELNQMLPTVLRTRDERRKQLLPEFVDAIRWWDSATVDGHPHLKPAGGRASRFMDFPRPVSTDLRDDVFECVARARAVGCNVLVHDLTRPEIGLAVARILVPGLRHFWRRLGPGRLYDTPVRLGWLDRPRTEEEMNPLPMFV